MDAATPSRVAGLDWASRLHAVCVLEPDGQVRARFDVPHTGSDLRGLTRRLVKLGVGQVAIERPDGPVVEALLAAGLEVVVIPGRQVKRSAAALARPATRRPVRRLGARRRAAQRRAPAGAARS